MHGKIKSIGMEIRESKERADVDKIAACVILQSYLDYIANNNAGEQ